MSSFGYPDFQQTVRWFGDPIVDELANYAGVQLNFGTFEVASFKSLTLLIKPIGGDGVVTVTYRSRSSQIATNRSQKIYARDGRPRVVTIPAAGDVIDRILFDGAVNPQQVSIIAVPSNIDPWVKYAGNEGVLAYERNRLVAAGTTYVPNVGYWEGLARFELSAAAYPVGLLLNEHDHLGAEVGVHFEDAAIAARTRGEILMGAGINWAAITNPTAADVLVSFSMVGSLAP